MRLLLILGLTMVFSFVHSSPQISIVKKGDTSVKRGNVATYKITIKNDSSKSL